MKKKLKKSINVIQLLTFFTIFSDDSLQAVDCSRLSCSDSSCTDEQPACDCFVGICHSTIEIQKMKSEHQRRISNIDHVE